MKVEGLVDELNIYLFVKKDPVLQSWFVFMCMNDTFLLVSVPKQISQRCRRHNWRNVAQICDSASVTC